MKKKSRVLMIGCLLIFSIFLSTSPADATVDICLISPIGNGMYRSGETIDIHWKAENTPACAWSIEFYYQWGGSSSLYWIGSRSYSPEGIISSWSAPAVASESFLRIVARMTTDGGGICDTAYSGYMTIVPASTEKTLNLLAPNPTSCDNNNLVLGAGDTYEIIWDASGCLWNYLNVNLYYATSLISPGVFDWQLITRFGVPCSSSSYTWTVPDVDTSNARIKVEWYDLEANHRNPFTITPAPVNYCPIADAGSDQTVNEHSVVTLSGRDSYDPEGNAFTYQWEIVNPGGFYESQITLVGADTRYPYFTAPNVPVNVDLDFKLIVTAHPSYPCTGSPDEDIVTIRVRPLSTNIASFTPYEGWFKSPVTIFGENMGGSRVYLGGTEVSAGLIPLDSDYEFTFYTPDISLGYHRIEVGSADSASLYRVIDSPYQWQWGFKFENPGGFDLSWSDYVNCYGYDAVTWEYACCEWDGIFCTRACHSPLAQAIFDGYVQTMARPGACWGMSVASLKFLYEDFTLPFSGYDEVRDLPWNVDHPDSGITREIRRLHISQISAQVIQYLLNHLGDSPADHMARAQADTAHWRDKSHADYNPGVISIQHITPGAFDSFAGHALIPDHVEEISPGIFRIYVYDSNREELSTSLDNINSTNFASITDWENYPYITVDTTGIHDEWSFDMGGETWTANSGYTLTVSLGDSELDIPFYGLYYFPAEVSVRDHYTFPTSARGLGMILFGSADVGIKEDDGDLLGYDATGKLNFEIAGAMPVVSMTGESFRDQEFYWLPDKQYFVDIYGIKSGGVYQWKALNANTLFAVNDSQLNSGEKDSFVLEPGNSSLTIETTEPSKVFSVEMIKTFIQGKITYQRVFEVIDTQMDNSGSAWFRVTPDLKSLIYENNTGLNASFSARFIQTQLGPQPEPPDNQAPSDINEHTLLIKNIVVEGGEALKLTPMDWEDLDGTLADYSYFKSGSIPISIGDTNFDGDIDGLDLQAFAICYGSTIFEADLDKNEQINSDDMKIFASLFGQAINLK